jgi:hypothetical protein
LRHRPIGKECNEAVGELLQLRLLALRDPEPVSVMIRLAHRVEEASFGELLEAVDADVLPRGGDRVVLCADASEAFAMPACPGAMDSQ